MSGLRVWLVGFGTVGRWVAGALHAQAAQLASRYGTDDGLRATEADLLVEVTGSPPATGEPGNDHAERRLFSLTLAD